MSRKLIATKLLPETIATLDAAADRMHWSRATTLDTLVRLYAGTLTPDSPLTITLPVGARSPGQTRAKNNPKKMANRH